MKLSDIMSGAGLAAYAEIALILFFAAFIAVVIYVFSKRNRQRFERARYLPLDDRPPSEEASSEDKGPQNAKIAEEKTQR